MKSPVAYQGSKKRELTYIKDYEPKKFDKFVDVFGGGGCVSLFYNNRNIKTHYNDINKGLVDIFNIIQDKTKTEKLIEEVKKLKQDEETFYKLFDGDNTALKMLFITKHCFRGIINRRLPNKINGNMIIKNLGYENLLTYHDKIKNFNSTCTDYKDILEEYKNDENAFLYLDPPYVNKIKNTYGKEFNINDIEYIRKYFDSCKCKIMIHIDYTGYTRENFDKFYKKGYSVKYGSNPSKDVYTKYHLIATNY